MNGLADFIYECGQLKKFPRAGWLRIGIKSPESISDHSWRTAVIGYLLAKMEKADVRRVLELCIFHDLHEARIGDLEYLSARYLKKNSEGAVRDMTRGIFCEKEIRSLMKEVFAEKARESVIAKDADLLEMIAQAREYMDAGNSDAREWIADAKRKLRTGSAKKLAKELEKTSSNDFWKKLPPLTR